MTETEIVQTNIPEVDKSLQSFVEEKIEKVRRLHRQTLENVLEIGRTLIELHDALGWSEYMRVVTEELGLHKQSSYNYTNLAKLWDERPDCRESLRKMTLNGAYMLARKNIDEGVRQLALQMADEGEPLSGKEVKEASEAVKSLKTVEPGDASVQSEESAWTIGDFEGIDEEAKATLFDHPIAEKVKELRNLERLSKRSQRVVAQILSNNEAESIKEAIHILQERNREQEQKAESFSFSNHTPNQDAVQVASPESIAPNQTVEVPYQKRQLAFNYSYLGTDWRSIADQVGRESIDLILAEAPMKHQFMVDGGYRDLAHLADEVLKEGGFLLTTTGHKNAMWLGDELHPLEPLHLLTVRRQPGRTRSIVGINVACASVIFALAYKPPFRSPNGMLVDLQTVDTGDIGEMAEAQSGIEHGVERFLTTLLEEQATLLHLTCTRQEHFDIRGDVIEMAKKLKVNTMYTAG